MSEIVGTSGPSPVLVVSRWPKPLVAATALTVGILVSNVSTAQQPVQTYPLQATTGGLTASSTMGTASTFQMVFASNSNRHGCMIQTVSGAPVLLYEGSVASALAYTNVSAKALTLTSVAPAPVFSCQQGAVVLTGEIDVTSTNVNTAYFAVQW